MTQEQPEKKWLKHRLTYEDEEYEEIGIDLIPSARSLLESSRELPLGKNNDSGKPYTHEQLVIAIGDKDDYIAGSSSLRFGFDEENFAPYGNFEFKNENGSKCEQIDIYIQKHMLNIKSYRFTYDKSYRGNKDSDIKKDNIESGFIWSIPISRLIDIKTNEY